MGILNILLGRKNKKNEMENENKADKPVGKTEINRQDVRDAMLGRNGKTTVNQIAIDTVTMREIPMRDKLVGLKTIRGIVTSIQCFNRTSTDNFLHRDFVVLTKSIKHTQLLELIIGEKVFELLNDNNLPEVNIGDDVEIMAGPGSYKVLTPNSSCREVQSVLVLKNRTSGSLWCFSMRKHALGF